MYRLVITLKSITVGVRVAYYS